MSVRRTVASSESSGDDTADEGASTATRRGGLAGARASELRGRLVELASGGRSSETAAEFAEENAKHAVNRAEAAHRSALSRHDETRRVHLRAAAAHEQAAVILNRQDSDGHQSAAERHRDAAAEHAAVLASFGDDSPRPVSAPIPPSATRR